MTNLANAIFCEAYYQLRGRRHNGRFVSRGRFSGTWALSAALRQVNA